MSKRKKDTRILVSVRVRTDDCKLARIEARERDWKKHPALARKGVLAGAPPGYQTILGEWIRASAKRARKNLGDRKRRRREAAKSVSSAASV